MSNLDPFDSNVSEPHARNSHDAAQGDPREPDLLGYLLGALEPGERSAIEIQIADRPELRERLCVLRRSVRLLKDESQAEPPPGLAARTCASIFAEREAAGASSSRPAHAEAIAAPRVPERGSVSLDHRRSAAGRREPLSIVGRGWRAADLVVAVGVCVAIMAMVFPLVHASRTRSQIAACANKLREIGLALTGYSERHSGLFPEVPESGNLSMAGVYAPTLVDSGFLDDSRIVICPGSKLADAPTSRIPTLDELRKATPERLRELRATMGGSYGYAFGYRENGRYKPTRNRYRDSFALAADVPADDLTSSPNHGRSGQNVLLEDGHVVYICTRRLDGSGDDIFENDLGQVAAGCHADDSVVARSDASP